MKRFSWAFGVCIAIYIVGIVFLNRSAFFTKTDRAFWKEKYEQSQWVLPLSIRTIGDDGVYLAEGIRLIEGGDPSIQNAEMPPLGKYLIGLTYRLTGNALWYGLISTLVCIFLAYVLLVRLTKNVSLATVSAMLLALDPLILSQCTVTMLDSLHAALLVLIVLVAAYISPKRPLLVILSGISLGAFAATKFPPLALIPFVFLSLVVLQKTKRIRLVILVIITSSLTYSLVYVRYFLMGHTIIDFLKLQKWIAMFYLKGGVKPTIGSVWTTIFAARYQNLFTRRWETTDIWSASWIIIVCLSIIGVGIAIRKRHKHILIRYMFLTVICMFVVFTVIPFWTRYLIVVLPLCYVLTAYAVSHMTSRLVRVCVISAMCIANVVASLSIVFPTPEKTVQQFLYSWQYGFFQDMYEHVSQETTYNKTRSEFQDFYQRAWYDSQLETVYISVTQLPRNRFKKRQELVCTITYITRTLGKFTQTSIIPVVRENGAWRVEWNPTHFISGLTYDLSLSTEVTLAKRGSIAVSEPTPLAEDIESQLVWVTPNKVIPTEEPLLLQTLSTIVDGSIPPNAIHHRIMFNTIPSLPVPLLALPANINSQHNAVLRQLSGVSFTPAYVRRKRESQVVNVGDVGNSSYFECCSRLYSTMLYDGISGRERELNDRLKGTHGGSLTIVDSNNHIVRSIISLEKNDGENVQL